MAKSTFPSDAADKYVVRLPDGMRDRIAEAAKANNRTMNAEIVARLQTTFGPPVFSGEASKVLGTPHMRAIANELTEYMAAEDLRPVLTRLAEQLADQAIKELRRAVGEQLLQPGAALSQEQVASDATPAKLPAVESDPAPAEPPLRNTKYQRRSSTGAFGEGDKVDRSPPDDSLHSRRQPPVAPKKRA